jgi:hypothetical protein
MAISFLLIFPQRAHFALIGDKTARLTPIGMIDRRRAKGVHGAGSRHAGRPTRLKAAALPAGNLDATQELFLARGFEATSLNQIAAGAAATRTTLRVKIGDRPKPFANVVRRMPEDDDVRLSQPRVIHFDG